MKLVKISTDAGGICRFTIEFRNKHYSGIFTGGRLSKLNCHISRNKGKEVFKRYMSTDCSIGKIITNYLNEAAS